VLADVRRQHRRESTTAHVRQSARDRRELRVAPAALTALSPRRTQVMGAMRRRGPALIGRSDAGIH